MDQPPTNNTMPQTSPAPSQLPQEAILRCSLQTAYEDDRHNDSEGGSEDDYGYNCERNEEAIKDLWLSRSIALCRHLWPSVKDDALSVEFLSYGSYNCIFSISMATPEDGTVEYVLRIPDFDLDILHVVGILEYLAKFTDLKVPTVITWDATVNNPLGHVYVILSRIPGKCLENVWKDLAHDQKLLLAKELAQLYHQIESVTNPIAGTIQVHNQEIKYRDELIDRTFVEAFGASIFESKENLVNWHNPVDGIRASRHDPPGLPVSDIMAAIFKRRIYEKKNRVIPDEFALEWFEVCQRIIDDMVEMGLFDSGNNDICLCHPDLFPRNIMVDFLPDITITGVLDWDGAMFAPRFAGRVLPRWLWQTIPKSKSNSKSNASHISEAISDCFYDIEPLDSKCGKPNSPQNTEIKLAFDKAVGESWVSEATSEWLSLARALLRVGQAHILANQTFRDMAKYKEKWKSLSTDAIENLYFWTEKHNLPIFEEPDDLGSEEAPTDTIPGDDEPIPGNREDDERVSSDADLSISLDDRTSAE